MQYVEMNLEQRNVKLRELKAEVVASFEGRWHTGKETMDLLARKWAEFRGVPFVQEVSELPEMIPVSASQLKSALPGGMPGPIMVNPSTGVETPMPAMVANDPAENIGKGKWTEHKVPDVDPLAGVTNSVPPPPARTVRTPP